MAERMTLKEYAKHKNISFNTLVRIKTHYYNGLSADEICKRLDIYKKKLNNIIDWFNEGDAEKNRVKRMYALPIQYWMSEQEMEIQEYRLEDLKGDELQILNEL
jgi:transposase